ARPGLVIAFGWEYSSNTIKGLYRTRMTLALFLLLFTNGDEPPPIRMFIITLRGNTGLLDLYLRARPETRSDKIACSACCPGGEAPKAGRQTGASRDLGDRLCGEAEQFWTVDRGRYPPTTAM
ncbi:hypothetical protein FOZ62_019460, partial [Perkinsus olseni]